MPRTALALVPYSLSISVALGLSLFADVANAAPEETTGPPDGPPSSNAYSPRPGVDGAMDRRSSAIDAALGTPPASSRDDPNSTDDPGYSQRRGGGTEDKAYGSTARSLGTTGEMVDGYDIYEVPQDDDNGYAEQVPDVHIVQRGDTLWDISSYYLRDSYAWPRLWSWNEHVTNAHWIFPGDRIRLYDPRFGPRGDDVPDFRYSKTRVPDGSKFETLVLNQFAFVDAAEFETSMKIVGGGEAAVMMSTLDTVYMQYDRGRPPIPGERLVVYAPQEKVRDLKDKKVIGYIVQIMGEVEVESLARKTAEGTIATAHNPIERGYRVGPLRRQFRRIDEVPPDKSASGVVVATLNDTSPIPIRKSFRKDDEVRAEGRRRKSLLGEHVLVGETQFVVVNLGRKNGLEVGNVLEVVRKGDEYVSPYKARRKPPSPYVDGWPRRVIGAAVVVQTQDETALLATTYSRREIERGDHVELRGPEVVRREREEEAAASKPSGDGKVKASASGKAEKKQGGFTIGGSTSGSGSK